MKAIDQNIFINDPQGRVGNCLQAAVASIIEFELESVPHFAALPDDTWFDQMCNWLNENGFDIYDYDAEDMPSCDEYMLVIGKSPRGVSHSVVYYKGELAHDPHPSRDGVQNVKWCAIIRKNDSKKLIA